MLQIAYFTNRRLHTEMNQKAKIVYFKNLFKKKKKWNKRASTLQIAIYEDEGTSINFFQDIYLFSGTSSRVLSYTF